MRKYPRRLLSVRAFVVYFILVLVILNNAVGTVANVDFVLTASGNSRLVSVWNFFVSPKGNLLTIVLGILWLSVLVMWPERGLAHFTEGADSERLPTSSALPVDSQMSRPARVTTKLVELEPNIVALETTYCVAHNDEDGVIVEGEDRYNPIGSFWGDENLLAVTVPYQNRFADKDVGDAEGVSAQIVYYCYGGKTWRKEINRAAWLSEEESYMTFGVDDTHKLIVATVEGNAKEGHAYGVQRDFWGSRIGRETRRTSLDGDLIRLTVSLRDARRKVIKISEFMMEITREPEFDIKLVATFEWKQDKLGSFTSEAVDLIERSDKGDLADRLETEFGEWTAKVAAFLVAHLGDDYKKRFLPAPRPEGAPVRRGLMGLSNISLEPIDFKGRVLAKAKLLQAFSKEVLEAHLRSRREAGQR